jgi:hypothetical protein
MAAVATTLIAALLGVPALVASPAFASTVPAATVASAITNFDSTAEKTIAAICPAGKRVLGGGVRVNAGTHVVVMREEPISTGGVDSYVVGAAEDSIGTTATWSLQAYAICSDPVPGLQIVAAINPSGSDQFSSVFARCPVGTNAIGAGGRIIDGQGRVRLLTQVEGGVTDNTRTTAAGEEELTGFSGNWAVVAYTVCATLTNRLDMQVIKTVSANDTSVNKVATAVCPAGMAVTGGTGWAELPGDMASVNVDASRTRIQVIANQDASNVPPGIAWNVSAMAFCVY